MKPKSQVAVLVNLGQNGIEGGKPFDPVSYLFKLSKKKKGE